ARGNAPLRAARLPLARPRSRLVRRGPYRLRWHPGRGARLWQAGARAPRHDRAPRSRRGRRRASRRHRLQPDRRRRELASGRPDRLHTHGSHGESVRRRAGREADRASARRAVQPAPRGVNRLASAVRGRRPGRVLPGGRWIPVVVIAAIAAFVLLPVRKELMPHSAPALRPLEFGQLPARPRISRAATLPVGWSPKVRALILYDHSGKYGWLGSMDAIFTANLAGHFGSWKAEPASDYTAGELDHYTATIYLGSLFGQRLPPAFLDDVLRTRRPVVWVAYNITELEHRAGDFRARYGWHSGLLDRSPVATVRYKGTSLTRWTHNDSGIMGYSTVDPAKARVLARAVRPD